MTVKSPDSPHVLEKDSDAVGSVGYRCRKSHEDEDGKRQERTAARNHVEDPGDKADDDEDGILDPVTHDIEIRLLAQLMSQRSGDFNPVWRLQSLARGPRLV